MRFAPNQKHWQVITYPLLRLATYDLDIPPKMMMSQVYNIHEPLTSVICNHNYRELTCPYPTEN